METPLVLCDDASLKRLVPLGKRDFDTLESLFLYLLRFLSFPLARRMRGLLPFNPIQTNLMHDLRSTERHAIYLDADQLDARRPESSRPLVLAPVSR
jgi:hypothetical protein